MKNKLFAVAAAAGIILTAAGCGKQEAVTGDTSVSGKIEIYTSMYEDIIDNMETTLEQKFPNLDIEFFQGGSGTIQSKIAAEMDSGKLGCDILMVAEPSYSLELKDAGILHPYKYADADKLMFDYDKDGYWFPVRVCNMVLAYNPDKCKREEVPTSFKDFAENSAMKNELSMSNPLTSGTAYSSVVGLLDKYGTKPDTKLGDMYANSIFKYAQMLMFLGKDKEAIPVYEKLAAIDGLTSDQKRWFTFELAQLMVKVAECGTGAVDTGLLDSAQKQIDKLMWIQDIWFGRSVALMAHIRMAKGNIDGAKSLVDDYMDQLVDMDEQLRSLKSAAERSTKSEALLELDKE